MQKSELPSGHVYLKEFVQRQLGLAAPVVAEIAGAPKGQRLVLKPSSRAILLAGPGANKSTADEDAGKMFILPVPTANTTSDEKPSASRAPEPAATSSSSSSHRSGPRAKSALSFFFIAKRAQLAADNPGASHAALRTIAKERWQALDGDAKKPFEQLAASDRNRINTLRQKSSSTSSAASASSKSKKSKSKGTSTNASSGGTDSDGVRSARSAQQFFTKVQRHRVAQDNAGLSGPSLTGQLNRLWVATDSNGRSVYADAASEDLLRYRAAFAAFNRAKQQSQDESQQGSESNPVEVAADPPTDGDRKRPNSSSSSSAAAAASPASKKPRLVESPLQLPQAPVTAFQLFSADLRPKLKDQGHAGISRGEMAKLLLDKWNALSQAEKDEYNSKYAKSVELFKSQLISFRDKSLNFNELNAVFEKAQSVKDVIQLSESLADQVTARLFLKILP